MSNSRHSSEIVFSRRCAVTTNRTRCSRTSIVFQGTPSLPPALAALAPECKGCLGTPCKECHGTEHEFGRCGAFRSDLPQCGIPVQAKLERGFSHHPTSHPTANRKAAHTSFIRPALNCATRFPNRSCDTVMALCRFTAQATFIPSSSCNATSDGTPRIVLVIGATVTVARYSIALFRVKTSTGRFLSGAAKLYSRTSPRAIL